MNTLHDIIAAEVDAAPTAMVATCADALRRHFGPTTTAVIFYGGGLRAPEPDAVLDFYVLVDDLGAALRHPLARLGAWALPPNVYFLTVPSDAAAHRCKVAVMTHAAFARGMTAFAPHLWARFAQAVNAAYMRDAQARAMLIGALSTAVRHTVASVMPLMPPIFTVDELWTRAFTESYRTELRPEVTTRATELAGAPRYGAITATVLGDVPRHGRRRAEVAWMLRRPWGKLLNALRLMKAAFTFDGGLDYAVAKIARHSGITVAVRDSDRRVPLVGGIRIFIEAWRRGGVR